MTLLVIYVFIAVVFSFLCSIAEAVLLSVDLPYVAGLEKQGKHSAVVLKRLKENIGSPLAVILTLNTIAHTMGAAGAGAQAAIVFGNAYLGLISAVLTLLILIFSEIIPKALGATYWRQLAPATATVLDFLIKVFYPFVWLSNRITRCFSAEGAEQQFKRNEFTALAELGEQSGELDPQEAEILQNLFLLRETSVRTAMTPHSVLFSMPADASCSDYLELAEEKHFSRIPLAEGMDKYVGFVLRSDILLAYAKGNKDAPLRNYCRDLPAILDKFSLLKAFDDFVEHQHHMKLVVSEYGDAVGILTLEDILEALIGLEIVDETDNVSNMQQLAHRLHKARNS